MMVAVRVAATITVVALERVTVSAGSFDAWKLTSDEYFNRGDGRSGKMLRTYWYAPEVKRIVREEYQDTSKGQTYNRNLIELAGYKPAP